MDRLLEKRDSDDLLDEYGKKLRLLSDALPPHLVDTLNELCELEREIAMREEA